MRSELVNVERYKEKMTKWPNWLMVNLLLALGIFLCALLGKSLGIKGPALAISVVWPATGLSLASLLLFGYWAGVGVFIGNFAYNFLNYAVSPPQLTYLNDFISAFFVSLGSLSQALFSTHLIRTYSTPLIFRTVKDILIFLIPASLISCLIGSTVGVATLAIAGGVEKSLVMQVWTTFWLGDTIGIYVMTPLIIVWTLIPWDLSYKGHMTSIVFMALLFAAFLLVTFSFDFPLPHIFIPISIWAAYLFRMHGASITIFLMSAASIAFALFHGYTGTSLIAPISFIGTTTAVSLLIAAVVNERTEAWALLDSRNIYLEKQVDIKAEILEQVRAEVSQKWKFATQGSLFKLLSLQIHASLGDIGLVTKSSQEAIEDVQKSLAKQSLSSEEKQFVAEKLHHTKKRLSDTQESRMLIAELLAILKSHFE
jgi:integral membrane sensor domain MASE1